MLTDSSGVSASGAFLHGDRVGRGQGGDIRQEAHVELRRHVAQVGLSRGRHPEARADGPAHREIVRDLQASRELAVQCVAELVVALEPQRGADQEAIADVGLEVDVAGHGTHAVLARVARLKAGEAVGTDPETLGGEVVFRVDVERVRLAVLDLERLVPVLQPERHVHGAVEVHVDGLRKVEVRDRIGFRVRPGVVVHVDVVARTQELRVDGVVDVELGIAAPGGDAHVVEPAGVVLAAHATRDAQRSWMKAPNWGVKPPGNLSISE